MKEKIQGLRQEAEQAEGKAATARGALATALRGELKVDHDAWTLQLKQQSDAVAEIEKSLTSALATETSERLKALTKAADDCAKVRSEMEGSNKAHLIAVNEVKSKIDSVQSGASQALNGVEKDLTSKMTTGTGTVESLKTELTKTMDTKLRSEMDSERGKNKISRDKLDQELRKAIEDASKCAKQQLGSVKEQVDSEIKATKERANTAADQVVQVQGDVLKLTVLVTALKVDGQTLKQEAAAACSTAEGLIKSLETLSDTLKALGKDMAQQKQEMITTRAHLHEGGGGKGLKDKLAELQGKVKSVVDETAGLKSQVSLFKDEATAAKNKMKALEEVALIKADVASSKSALETLQTDYQTQQLKILELDGVKLQVAGLKETAGANSYVSTVAHTTTHNSSQRLWSEGSFPPSDRSRPCSPSLPSSLQVLRLRGWT